MVKFKVGDRVESRFWVGTDPEVPTAEDEKVYFSGVVVGLGHAGCIVLVDRGDSRFRGRTSCLYADLVLSPLQEA